MEFIKTFLILYVFVTIVCIVNGIILDKYNTWKEIKSFTSIIENCNKYNVVNDYIICE